MAGGSNGSGGAAAGNPLVSAATRERYAALEAYLEKAEKEDRGGRWLVLTHDNPDPDALAAAVMLAFLLRHALRQQVTIGYGGIIGRAENREVVRALRLEVSQVRSLHFEHYRHFALVDTQPRTGNNSLPADVTPTFVLDHHPLRKTSRAAAIVDVRPEYGASATMAGEYLLASGLEPNAATATALVYAIRSETQDFAREGGGRDKAIYDAFLPRANKRLLGRIQNAPLPFSYFCNLHQALENLQTVDTLVVSHLGGVQQPDIVPEIADLLLRLEGKTWSLCTGLYGDRVYLSIRTTNPRAEAGKIMRRLVGRRGKGGGHGMLAGGWVAIGNSDPKTIQKSLAERLAKALRKKPEKLTALELRCE